MKKTSSKEAKNDYYNWYKNEVNLDDIELYRTAKSIIYKKFKNPTIFDLGCGIGYITDYLGATGFDINKQAIIEAKKRYKKTTFYHADISKLDLKKLKLKPADVLVCFNLIEHMSDRNRQKLLTEIIPGLIKRKGLLFFSLGKQYYPPNLLNMLIKRGSLFDPTHIYNWRDGEFIEIIRKKFRIIKIMHVASFLKYVFFSKYLKNETLILAELK